MLSKAEAAFEALPKASSKCRGSCRSQELTGAEKALVMRDRRLCGQEPSVFNKNPVCATRASACSHSHPAAHVPCPITRMPTCSTLTKGSSASPRRVWWQQAKAAQWRHSEGHYTVAVKRQGLCASQLLLQHPKGWFNSTRAQVHLAAKAVKAGTPLEYGGGTHTT